MVDFILDTSILIDILRQDTKALQWFNGIGQQRAGITPVVWMETVQGATSKQKRQQILKFLRQFHVEHSTSDDNKWAMLQIARFSLGYVMSFADVMIASVSVRLNVPIYTLNLKHYTPLPSVNAKRPY